MNSEPNTGVAKGIWHDFLALCERLIGSVGLMPCLVIVGIYLGKVAYSGQYLLLAAICIVTLGVVGYFVARIGRSNVRHAISVSFFVLFFGGFGFAIGIFSR